MKHKARKLGTVALVLYSIVSGAQQSSISIGNIDSLKITMCGTSASLSASGREQACDAIGAPDSLYLIDVVSGSAVTAPLVGIPIEKLRAIFRTRSIRIT